MKLQTVHEPLWPPFLAIAAFALIHFALPERLSVGPSWLLFAVIGILLVPGMVSHRMDRHDITRVLTFIALGAITCSLIGSLGLLIEGLPRHRDAPNVLLRSAALLWVGNVLVFGLWYWKLDAGGPLGRALPGAKSSFLFPQMTRADIAPGWTPVFLDYLFLAFNTSTAFSPTDTSVLSRWAKVLMMLQSIISLMVIALLAARAVNIL